MDITSAVKRLERAGSENSRATKKLHDAATTVARLIEQQVPVNLELPRGYRVTRVRSNAGSDVFLLGGKDEYGDARYWIDGIGTYLHGDFSAEVPSQTRAGSLQFAKDVAEGLLGEIAEALEKRTEESEEAANALEQATEKASS